MISQTQINEVVKKIVNNYKPEKIYIFGSYAIGTATENSDLDLIIIKNTDLPPHKRIYNVRMLLLDTIFPLDILVYTPEEIYKEGENKFSFIHNIFKIAKVIYEKQ
ncbi:MAG: nucleotidyltransferase domain-containing protein [Bacteroidia bacterium]|nr:nucleotidyltransferase domain-containing protein [Bacteroidia bacterium]